MGRPGTAAEYLNMLEVGNGTTVAEDRAHDSISKAEFDFSKVDFNVGNLRTHQALGTTRRDLAVKTGPHDLLMLKLCPAK